MSSTRERILNAQAQSTSLLATVTATYNDSLTYPSSRDQAVNLTQQIKSQEQSLKQLSWKTQKEHQDVQDREGSTVRKTFSKWGGHKSTEKWDAKTAQEQHEFEDAFKAEEDVKAKLHQLKQDLVDAEAARNRTEIGSKTYMQAQAELDNLYNFVFADATSEFPDQEAARASYNAAEQAHKQATTRLEAESTALRLLSQASEAFKQASSKMQSADNYSTYDMLGGGSMTSMMKRDNMNQAQMSVMNAQRFISEAQHYVPEITREGLDALNVGTRDGGLGDVMFDNIFSDMRVADEIDMSIGKLKAASTVNERRVAIARQRVETVKWEVKQKEEQRQSAKWELQRVRAGIVERVAGGRY